MKRVLVLAITAGLLMIAAPAEARTCYWSERFDKGCRNQSIYLTKKKPVSSVEVWVSKPPPCDVPVDRCNG
jgi:hypothetical protein